MKNNFTIVLVLMLAFLLSGCSDTEEEKARTADAENNDLKLP